MNESINARKTQKPKQIGVSEGLKKELELLGELLGISQSELMEELFRGWKEQNKETWKKLNNYKKMKSSL